MMMHDADDYEMTNAIPGCETKQYGAHFPFATILALLPYQFNRESYVLVSKKLTCTAMKQALWPYMNIHLDSRLGF